ncbi:hypothetical protein J2T15_003758 [Paenibacillus harenae]|uniref:Uncharacterized protein n=2 Tax=Paenibacillus harenae TaxID=306543 RepID=A0ABT9U417_PAEHA|nr:hypothetical protein [Paenibacillus harenae]
MSIPEENNLVRFIGKDDDEIKQVAVFIEGKHGKIGIIRPSKPSTILDRKNFLESLAKIAVRVVVNEKTREAQDQT